MMTSSKSTSRTQSTFIITCRLLPSVSFEKLQFKVRIGDDYTIDIQDDLAWVTFQANTDTWEDKRDKGFQYLRSILSAATLLVTFPFDFELIQWIEDKPRSDPESGQYVLGKLEGKDFVVQRTPPRVTKEHLRKGYGYLVIGELNTYFRMAMLDYSVALSMAKEAMVFCARSVEWVEQYFRDLHRRDSNAKKEQARTILKRELCFPPSHLSKFFQIANETTIARHARPQDQVRTPAMGEIRYCVLLCMALLDRFGLYVWYQNKQLLHANLPFPSNFDLPSKFSEDNDALQNDLNKILSGEVA